MNVTKKVMQIAMDLTTKNARLIKTPIVSCYNETAHLKAVEYLKMGHVIAVPTDTIYGLACNALNPEAIKMLYSIKGRDAGKPIAICVSNIADVEKWGDARHLENGLLGKLLPGPVTVVLNRTPILDNPYLNPMTTKIGIRIPNNVFINSVTSTLDLPLALTSANLSNQPSTLSIKEFEHLYSSLGAVFDGGLLNEGLDKNRTGSTVVDLSLPGYYTVIRHGSSFESVLKVFEKSNLLER